MPSATSSIVMLSTRSGPLPLQLLHSSRFLAPSPSRQSRLFRVRFRSLLYLDFVDMNRRKVSLRHRAGEERRRP
ncbi:hypothetical protein Bca52824_014561 [Brassica carinata]|uniref:Uncharacterized protein n=1 Tax=Brassica carinata TaxID=52824 RepID=A0A8X7W024_BRACI|nr:hypothetical protein Bca52824_014561 [Brassica carinata]